MIGVNDIKGTKIATPLIDFAKAIGEDGFENLRFPEEYPACIKIHQEKPAVSVPLHWHEGAELIYSRNWNLILTVNGHRYHVKPKEFFLISPCLLHSICPEQKDEEMEVMSITLNPQPLARINPNIQYCEIFRDTPKATEEAWERMIALCERMYEQVDSELGENNFLVNSILYEMVHVILECFWINDEKGPKKISVKENKLKTVLEYINDNYRENLTTRSIAEHFGYNREYFCRVFKRYSNMTFKEYLVNVRLDAVVKEMQQSDENCSVIALSHGFPDAKGFCSAFKNRYGMNPGQYRKLCINK